MNKKKFTTWERREEEKPCEIIILFPIFQPIVSNIKSSLSLSLSDSLWLVCLKERRESLKEPSLSLSLLRLAPLISGHKKIRGKDVPNPPIELVRLKRVEKVHTEIEKDSSEGSLGTFSAGPSPSLNLLSLSLSLVILREGSGGQGMSHFPSDTRTSSKLLFWKILSGSSSPGNPLPERR